MIRFIQSGLLITKLINSESDGFHVLIPMNSNLKYRLLESWHHKWFSWNQWASDIFPWPPSYYTLYLQFLAWCNFKGAKEGKAVASEHHSTWILSVLDSEERLSDYNNHILSDEKADGVNMNMNLILILILISTSPSTLAYSKAQAFQGMETKPSQHLQMLLHPHLH